jgi:hypothetical protein
MDPARAAAQQAWLAERQERQRTDPALARLRALCLALPEVTERLSHGEPCWFVQGKRNFACYADHHHDDRLAFTCAAQPGAQQALVAADPTRYSCRPTSAAAVGSAPTSTCPMSIGSSSPTWCAKRTSRWRRAL